MVAKKTIYIFEGPDSFTFCRGEALRKNLDCNWMYDTRIKHKGLFSPYIILKNIDQLYIGTAKRLMVNDKPTNFEVIRVRKDFWTGDPYMPDIPPSIIAQVKSLKNEVEIWKRKYFDVKKLSEDGSQRDRFKQRVDADFDFVSKQKNKFFGSGDSFGGGFASRWGIPSPGIGTQQQNSDDG